MPDVNYPIGTVEYIKATVTCDVVLDTQTVAISIDGKTTWLPATWLGDPGTTRSLRTTSVHTFDTKLATRSVYVKITDSPEIPIIKLGGKLATTT